MIKNIKTFLIVAGVLAAGLNLTFAQNENHSPVCARGEKDSVRCHARVVVDGKGSPAANSAPAGFGPAQFLGAYNLTGQTGSNQVLAIVDAYDHPSVLSDLNTYSATFGIPALPACVGSIVNSLVPCFQKVNQNGGTSYPAVNAGWALEIALDVEAAHAVCQNCKILLVEANSNSYADLMAAVDQAVLLGATVVSNSYGSGEFSGEGLYDSHFNHPGVAITFSSGDGGYGAEYPASSPYVTAVGGTTLTLSGNNYVNETVWNGAGSGCSAFESKPSWQQDSLCLNRTVADVSADADPNTGAAVYDSVRYQGKRGWFKVGGTSLASPIIAGVYALAGGINPLALGASVLYVQNNGSNLHDVVSGNNGSCGTYLCKGVLGYDGPTGLGTPNGVSAF